MTFDVGDVTTKNPRATEGCLASHEAEIFDAAEVVSATGLFDLLLLEDLAEEQI